MAFTQANQQTASLGNLKAYVADWTGTVGDSDGEITLKGGRVWLCNIVNQDTVRATGTGYAIRPTPYSVDVTSGTITITVKNRHTVTTGRLLIIYS